jgi:NADPH-dependent 2,4-dienoyl-CoA reductase/sulfur reductase-like enzyme
VRKASSFTPASRWRIEGNGRVRRVVATDGATHDADVVIAGWAWRPTWVSCRARVSKSVTASSYPTGARRRCPTCSPGDVALHPNPILGQIIRVEQWQNAQHQARRGRNMLGHHEPFTEVPWFWSDQYDVNLQMAGLPTASDDVVFRVTTRAGRSACSISATECSSAWSD